MKLINELNINQYLDCYNDKYICQKCNRQFHQKYKWGRRAGNAKGNALSHAIKCYQLNKKVQEKA